MNVRASLILHIVDYVLIVNPPNGTLRDIMKKPSKMRKIQAILFSLLIVTFVTGPGRAATDLPDTETLQTWVREMKTSPRGPFSQIRWFCGDGSILPPKPYACKDHGGGVQHGEWTDRVKQMRAGGYYIGNVLVAVDLDRITSAAGYSDLYNQILIEKFMVSADDGWILRKARYYRGAFQSEDETAAARRLLMGLLEKEIWIERGFLPLRAGMNLLPTGVETATVAEVRQISLALSEKDAQFMPFRVKIHNQPGAEDAKSVRDYAETVKDPQLADEYERLAAGIDQVYASRSIDQYLDGLKKAAQRYPELVQALDAASGKLADSNDPGIRFAETGRLMAAIREQLPHISESDVRFVALETSLALETENFAAGAALNDHLESASRAARLDYLQGSIHAIYGAGLISGRQLNDLRDTFAKLESDTVPTDLYKSSLDYLARVPGWGSQWMRFHFHESEQTLIKIEPKANLFSQDQLRSSPLFVYANLLNDLLRDANQLVGIKHDFFGKEIGAGLRSLNPGLARGKLMLHLGDKVGQEMAEMDTQGIYLLPETVSDLPPVAGILTAGEGNPLSHVQLLARNLGIPNVAVDPSLIPQLAPHDGKKVILGVSPAGAVQLMTDEGQLDDVFAKSETSEALIQPDLEKLDLENRELIPLSQLRASDSGRIVGPKAGNLGELYHHYPEAVANGLAIPFGVFRGILDRPLEGGKQTVFEWMEATYSELEALPPGSKARETQTESFRKRLEQIILTVDTGAEFHKRLSAAMGEVFGQDGTYGVFVRSDTNVEDLPGFTGAGLNKTIPNVVGVDHVLAAIPKVWASPFSRRAFAWRQSKMSTPQHVYASVLLLRSVPSEKSGVMVTRDIDTGDADWISVAVNEGVGGAVDGQASESLRINKQTGEVKMLTQATDPWRRVIDPAGGMGKELVTRMDAVLHPDEVKQLIILANDLPGRYPSIVDAAGKPAPADIEFGFLKGNLRLFQIRPFLESASARSNTYLNALDEKRATVGGDSVNLTEPPL